MSKLYKVTKITDDVFNGHHPNNINEGYTTIGEIFSMPEEGSRFVCGNLMTSTVTKAINDQGFFQTRNSTYKLEEYTEINN